MIEDNELRVDLGDDGVLSIPTVNFIGEAGDGPLLTVIAGVHGTEYTSIAAARELIAELRPQELSGCVTVAPVVNLPAFWERTPFVVPFDGKNLNRSFPGNPDGTAAERIAHAVTKMLIKGSDYLIESGCPRRRALARACPSRVGGRVRGAPPRRAFSA